MTKTMQPVLPKPFSLEEASPEWWHKMRQETNQALDKLIASKVHFLHIAVDFQESEHTMNEQGEWDCVHASMRPEEFLADLDLDSDLLMLEACTACKRYYDERDDEWKW